MKSGECVAWLVAWTIDVVLYSGAPRNPGAVGATRVGAALPLARVWCAAAPAGTTRSGHHASGRTFSGGDRMDLMNLKKYRQNSKIA